MKKDIIIKNKKGQLHNENGPAAIYYNENGNIESEYFYISGESHNENGPAITEYNVAGHAKVEWYYLNDHCHNMDAPAIIGYSKHGKIEAEYFFRNDECYNTNVVKKWYKDNNLKMGKLTKEQLILRHLQIGY